MGTWGSQLDQDDLFCEAKELFAAHLQKGDSPRRAATAVIKEFAQSEGSHLVTLAVADCLWENGALSEPDLAELRHILTEHIDQAYWAELGADEAMQEERRRELEKFYRKLTTPPPKKTAVQAGAQLKKGDCFWYQYQGLRYGAVTAEIQGDYYLIVLTPPMEVPNCGAILREEMYTAAWFSKEGLLPQRRIHKLGQVPISRDFSNRCGLTIGADGSVNCRNIGQRATWRHIFRAFHTPRTTIEEFVKGAE